MVALLMVRLDGYNKISQTLAIAQLSEHQRKELVPTCEVLHIFITSIFMNEIVETIPVKEGSQLSEDVLVLIHKQTILAAKVQNQVR